MWIERDTSLTELLGECATLIIIVHRNLGKNSSKHTLFEIILVLRISKNWCFKSYVNVIPFFMFGQHYWPVNATYLLQIYIIIRDMLPIYNTLQRQNTEISKQIFSEKECRGLSPNFHIHASVSELYSIFPQSVSLFCWRKYVDRSWDYINRSQIHECWNWGWGRAIPRKGIYKGDFRCSVV